MNYIDTNKEAWEEAFDNRSEGWGDDIPDRIKNEKYPFFQPEMIEVLKKYDLKGKTVAQFCCNNGRELLSLVKNSGAREGFGFDIAENQIDFANKKAGDSGINCKFIQVNILDIGEEYFKRFDLIIITVGAISWFKNLDVFFSVVSRCLTRNGILIINEMHPVTNMFGATGEADFDESDPAKLINSYFNKEWIENSGIYYITKKRYESKTFTSYTHPFAKIINAICKSGLNITGLDEFDNDVSGLFTGLNNKEIPLSFILEAEKE